MNTLFSLITVLLVPLAPGTLIDSTSPVLVYSGSWLTDDTVSYAEGGSARYSSNVDASITFDVDTTGFTVFFLYTSGGGNFDVCIDDNPCTTITTDGLPAQGRVTFDELETGLKTVVLDVVSGPVYFDAVYVYPYTRTGSQTQTTFTTGGETQTGTYIYSITAGEVAIVVLLVALVVIQLSNWITWLWQRES
ncbi:MAG: hypothetical protein AAFV33_18735 [Chloroflexota bacterium]